MMGEGVTESVGICYIQDRSWKDYMTHTGPAWYQRKFVPEVVILDKQRIRAQHSIIQVGKPFQMVMILL